MDASAYLNFNGNCEEAFAFYAETFGGTVQTLLRWSDMPDGNIPPEMAKKVMHAHFNVGATSILGSDAPPAQYAKPQGYSVALGVDSNAEAERIFAALSGGGKVNMAMAETFFAHRFGMVTDRFGIPWMIVHAKN
jgi:PhnB protein